MSEIKRALNRYIKRLRIINLEINIAKSQEWINEYRIRQMEKERRGITLHIMALEDELKGEIE